MNKARVLGILLVVAGIVLHLFTYSLFGGWSILRVTVAIFFPICFIAGGAFLLFRKSDKSTHREQAAYFVVGFTPAHASKNIAIESRSNRLWIRDPEKGEKVVSPTEVKRWDRIQRKGTEGLLFEIEDAYGPATWFVPFFRAADIAPWLGRLNRALGSRS